MKLAKLSSWQPAPGRLLVWRPDGELQKSADSAAVDPGPASFLQGDHLGAFMATQQAGNVHRAWTGVATDVDGPLDADAMASALAAFVARHEGMRTWFDFTGGLPERRLLPAEPVLAPGAFEVLEVPAPDDWDSGWEEALVGLFDGQCRPDSWTPFLLGAIEREDGFGLFWGCDHAFTDGGSQLMMLTELLESYDAALAGRPLQTEPAPDQTSVLQHTREEHALAAAQTPESAEVQAWLDVVRRHGGTLPTCPLDLGLAPGETAPVVPLEFDLFSGEEVERFEALCRASGGSVTSGVFAILALTDTAITGADRWLGVTVVGTRGPAYLRSQGWMCNFAPVDFAVPASRDFAETVAAAHAGFKAGLAMAAVPAHVALGAMLAAGIATPEQLGSPQMMSFLDLRRFPGAGTPAYERALHFTGIGRTRNASMWINREPTRLHFGAQTPGTEQAQAAVAEYHRRIAETARGALEGGSGARHDG